MWNSPEMTCAIVVNPSLCPRPVVPAQMIIFQRGRIGFLCFYAEKHLPTHDEESIGLGAIFTNKPTARLRMCGIWVVRN